MFEVWLTSVSHFLIGQIHIFCRYKDCTLLYVSALQNKCETLRRVHSLTVVMSIHLSYKQNTQTRLHVSAFNFFISEFYMK